MGLTKNQLFDPTPAMKLYAFRRAELGEDATQIEISAQVGVAPETVSRWKQINGFNTWLEEQVSLHRAPIHSLLQTVAVDHLSEFRYWEAIALKFGYLSEKPNGSDDKIKRLIIDMSDDAED